jgi:transcriptional regulator with XRE-family HTH domain
MDAIDEILRHDLAKPDLSEGYAEAFEDAYIATQIKVLREQNQWTQAQLANELKTTQTVVSRIENVNYSAWNIRTLKKLARAFRLRLHVSFETYGSLIDEMGRFSRTNLERAPREKDSVLNGNEAQIDTQTDKRAVAKTGHTLQQLVGNTGLGVPLSDAFFQAVNHPMLPPQYLLCGSMTLQNLAGGSPKNISRQSLSKNGGIHLVPKPAQQATEAFNPLENISAQAGNLPDAA